MAERAQRDDSDSGPSQSIYGSTIGRDAVQIDRASRVIFNQPGGRRKVTTMMVLAVILAVGAFAFTERGRRMIGGRTGPNVTVAEASDVCDQRSGWIVKGTGAKPPEGGLARRHPRRYRAWLDGHGAVNAGQSETIITLNGSDSAALVIEDIKITVTERRPPLRGRHVVPQCGGGLPTEKHYAPVDLDELPVGQPVSLRTMTASQDQKKLATQVLGTVPLISFPFTVTKTDYSYVNLVAVTSTCDCTWKVDVEWLNGERRGIYRSARTFELSALTLVSPRSSPSPSPSTWS